MIVIAKFIKNDNLESENYLISKTLGKLGVIQRTAVASMKVKPRANEFWYCEVVKETKAGTDHGCFVLKPVARVEHTTRDGYPALDIVYLVPGTYDTEVQNNVILLRPRRGSCNWICSNSMRSHLIRRHQKDGTYKINAVLVVYQGDDWPKEAPRSKTVRAAPASGED